MLSSPFGAEKENKTPRSYLRKKNRDRVYSLKTHRPFQETVLGNWYARLLMKLAK